MGGGLLQRLNRDTLNFGQKTNAVCVNGQWIDVCKTPTGSSMKHSKPGRLALKYSDGDYLTVRRDSIPAEQNLLKPVFRNGKLLRMWNFNELIERSERAVPESYYKDAIAPMRIFSPLAGTSARSQSAEHAESHHRYRPRARRCGRDPASACIPELEVAGIVAVAGNVPLYHTERNARRIVDLSGRSDVPVYAGCERPIARESSPLEHVHGQTGLAGCELPEPRMPLESGHGVEFIIETAMSAESGTITLCHIGPLTNIGTALVKEPRIAGRIREIVLMGGARAGSRQHHSQRRIQHLRRS